MKFGKNIQDQAALLNPEWRPFWVNYKALKRLIKQIKHHGEKEEGHLEGAESGDNRDGVNTAGDESVSLKSPTPSMTTNERKTDEGTSTSDKAEKDVTVLQKRFLQLLHAELCKTSKFFATTQQAIRQHCALLQERVKAISTSKDLYEGTVEIEYGNIMRACLHMYKEVISLEKYAVLSFAGFDKILKKHDKLTNMRTRAKYMKHFVQRQDFAKYPQLLQTVAELEALFQDVSSHLPENKPMMSGDHSRVFLSAETQAALSDIPDVSAQMASLTSMQRNTLSPAARTRNTTDEDTAASVLLSGLASGIPESYARRMAKEEDEDDDESHLEAIMELGRGPRRLTRTAEDAGLDIVGLASRERNEHVKKARTLTSICTGSSIA